MRRVYFILLLQIMLTNFFVGCNSEYTPPELSVVYEGESVVATVCSYQWDGGVMDGNHPLSLTEQMSKIKRTDNDTLQIKLECEPEEIEARSWQEKYSGDEDSYEANFEKVDIDSSGVIKIPDKNGYIYEISITYAEYSAAVSYCFYISAY